MKPSIISVSGTNILNSHHGHFNSRPTHKSFPFGFPSPFTIATYKVAPSFG
jgi:hypothetical protein